MSNPLSDLPSLHLSRRGVLGMGAALGVGAAVSAYNAVDEPPGEPVEVVAQETSAVEVAPIACS